MQCIAQANSHWLHHHPHRERETERQRDGEKKSTYFRAIMCITVGVYVPKNTTICTWCVRFNPTDCMQELRISEWHSDNVLNMILPLYENTAHSHSHTSNRRGEVHAAILLLSFSSLDGWQKLSDWITFFFNEIFASFRNRTYINYSLDESTWSSSLSQLYHRLDDYVRKSRKFVFANMINNFEPQFQNDLWILLHKIMVNKGELLKWNETDFKLDFWHFLWHEI